MRTEIGIVRVRKVRVFDYFIAYTIDNERVKSGNAPVLGWAFADTFVVGVVVAYMTSRPGSVSEQ
jgi:hypothetical protein